MAFIRVFSQDGSYRDVPLDQDVLSLGREADNTVVLQGSASSRHHARIQKAPSGWIIEDLGSAHGTFLGGARVALQALQDGDSLQLGDSRIEFHEDMTGAPATAAFIPPPLLPPPHEPPPPLPPPYEPPPPLPAPYEPPPPMPLAAAQPPSFCAPLPYEPPPAELPPAAGNPGLKFALFALGLLVLLGILGVGGYFVHSRLQPSAGPVAPEASTPAPPQGPEPGTPPSAFPDAAAPSAQPQTSGYPSAQPPTSAQPQSSGDPSPVQPLTPGIPPLSSERAAFDLVISDMVLVKTPQAGSMRACIHVECGGRRATFHQNREYRHSDGVRLPLHVRLPDVMPSDTVKINVRLDDDEDRVCRHDAEDQTVIRFPAGREGPLTFSPTSRWIVKVHSRLERRGQPG